MELLDLVRGVPFKANLCKGKPVKAVKNSNKEGSPLAYPSPQVAMSRLALLWLLKLSLIPILDSNEAELLALSHSHCTDSEP